MTRALSHLCLFFALATLALQVASAIDQTYEEALQSIGLSGSLKSPRETWKTPIGLRNGQAENERVKSVEIVRPSQPWFFYWARHLAQKDTLGKIPKLPEARQQVCADTPSSNECGPEVSKLARAQRQSEFLRVSPHIMPVALTWTPPGGSIAMAGSGPGTRFVSKRTLTLDIGDPPDNLSPPAYRDLAEYIWQRLNDKEIKLAKAQAQTMRRAHRQLNKTANPSKQYASMLENGSVRDHNEVVLVDVSLTEPRSKPKGQYRLHLTMQELGIPTRLVDAAMQIAQEAVRALEIEKANERRRAIGDF